MPYATYNLPSIEEARETLHGNQLATYVDYVLVGNGQYVVDFNEVSTPALLSMIMHGYTLDFSGPFVKLIP
jgi:hypothetical protein